MTMVLSSDKHTLAPPPSVCHNQMNGPRRPVYAEERLQGPSQ